MTKYGFWLLLGSFILVGCTFNATPTGSSSDPTAAQQFLPVVSGYVATDADNISDALAAAGQGASLLSGNVLLAALVDRLDVMVQCYQSVGAVAARIYTQVDIGLIAAGETPGVGAVAVINQDRLADNFFACSLQTAGFSAQAAEPCGGSGTFTAGADTLHYVYGATAPDLCSRLQLHFDNQ